MLLLRLVSRAFYTDLIDFGVNAELSYRGPALLDERIRFLFWPEGRVRTHIPVIGIL